MEEQRAEMRGRQENFQAARQKVMTRTDGRTRCVYRRKHLYLVLYFFNTVVAERRVLLVLLKLEVLIY